MFSRTRVFVCTTALALSALQCKHSDTAPSKTADYVPNTKLPPPASSTSTDAAAGRSNGAPGMSSPQTSRGASSEESTMAGAGNGSTQAQKNGADEQSAAALSDSEIVAITAKANSAEVQQGELARKKAKDPRVRDFAAMMVDHHSEALRQQERLSVEPSPNPDSQRIQVESEDALAVLETKSGKDFDQAYLQLQIDEHRKVLKTLEQELLPAARNASLKAYLQDIKPKVESHLAQAERLQQELGSTSLKGSTSDGSIQTPRPLISNTKGQGVRLSNNH